MDDRVTDLHLGPVDLVVADRARSTAYYRDLIGLRVLAEDADAATLGVDTPLVRLVEEPGARPAGGEAGLFHLALLVPDRADLARWTQHAADGRVPLEGASDHVVSEALYLRDPDGHGIEVYADRDRAIWDGRVQELMTTLPLDLPDLLALADPGDRGLLADRFGYDRSTAELAAAAGITEKGAWCRVNAAVGRLRERVGAGQG